MIVAAAWRLLRMISFTKNFQEAWHACGMCAGWALLKIICESLGARYQAQTYPAPGWLLDAGGE